MRGQSPRGQRGAARWVDAAARLGHVATGSVYIIVGVVAALACFDARMRPLGTQGALHRALKGDLGAIALLAIALGLTADAVWQMVRAAVDADRVGPGITGATNRVAWIVTGITHFGLAIAVFKIALGIRQSTAESGVKRWTELIMSLPFGPWLVAALGIVVIGVGLVMLYRGWTGDVDRWLNLTELPPTIRAIVMASGDSVSSRGGSCSVSPGYFSSSPPSGSVPKMLRGWAARSAPSSTSMKDGGCWASSRWGSSPTASWSSFAPGIGRSESPEAPGLSAGHGGACRSIEGCHGWAGALRTFGI